ncbi:MAG TPA: nodulation protein NfeD [Geminicoccaceae bacterium]|nr:nodulation protein NfeD [Geminicoccaceae bacterium]
MKTGSARSAPLLSRPLAWLVLLALGLGLWTLEAAGQGRSLAIVLQIEGAIGPATARYIARGLAQAAERAATLVILRIDTPGGLDSSMRDIIREILAAPLPVVSYVHPSGARAASAGTYILYASHVAAMTPGTNLGAATPVALGGGFPSPGGEPEERDGREGEGEPADAPSRPTSAAEAKAVNDAAAYIRGLAELRGRNADWAERAVREGASLSAPAALEQQVITLVARDLTDLVRQLHGLTVEVAGEERTLVTTDLVLEHLDPDWRTRLLAAITNPNLALILMMIGIYGLIFEFMNPGTLYPGTIGAICLLIGLYALAALPVNYAGLGLIVLGVALMVAEGFAPSFGILGIGGGIALALGAMLLIEDVPGFELSWAVVAGIVATSIAFSLVVVRLAVTSHRREVVSGREQMIGSTAEVLDWSGRSGHVLVHGERWRAVAPAPLAPGRRVRVARIDGLTLGVEPEPPEAS